MILDPQGEAVVKEMPINREFVAPLEFIVNTLKDIKTKPATDKQVIDLQHQIAFLLHLSYNEGFKDGKNTKVLIKQ